MNIKYCVLILNTFTILGLIYWSNAQQTHINLKQGTLVGLKVFPDSTRNAVYAFLGIPYAEPPTGDLRFAPPKMHTGWNRTLVAMSMRPICPQLSNTIYDETATDELLARPVEFNEDCLYLNVWVSESGIRYGNLPVLVILTGEDMSYDWPRNRITGLDLAAEGLVVITVQYRTNIFGWLNVPGSNELNGNYGLLDQSLAFKWIQQNVKNFGGNPNQITLLGHGTSGAPCAFYHALFTNEIISPFSLHFNQLILMSSGNIERFLQPELSVHETSKVLVEKLGCQFEKYSKQLLQCLRSKSVSDLLKAFESIYDHGNGTLRLGPSLTANLKEMLGNYTVINNFPNTIIGITSNEGSFMQDYWMELARDSYNSLKLYINQTLLRNIFPNQINPQLNGTANNHDIDALNWRYFNYDFEENPIILLAAIQKFISEYNYEIPFYRILNVLSNVTEAFNNNNKIYAYINHFTNSMDIRGKINLFGGSSHTSDLPLLFGPTLFQQIARRRLNNEEEKIYRKMRTPFINFIKNGNPTPGKIYDGWLPYSTNNKFIYDLVEVWSNDETQLLDQKSSQQIKQLLNKDQSALSSHSRPYRNEFTNSYQLPKSNNRVSSTTHIRSSPYTTHLMKVYGFWEVFLPQTLSKEYALHSDSDTAITQYLLLMEASANAIRFKNGFFVMLGIVLFLLLLLSLCVYLLRRDPLSPSPQFNCDL